MADKKLHEIPDADLPLTGDEFLLVDQNELSRKVKVEEFATSAQGALADSAVQPNDLADVASSGDYSDLQNTPTITKKINIIIGDGQSVIVENTIGYMPPIDADGKIVSYIIAETSLPVVLNGEIEIDLLKSVSYPPEESDSITDSNFISLSNQSFNEETDFSSWITNEVEVGDSIGFKVINNTNYRRIHLILTIEVNL